MEGGRREDGRREALTSAEIAVGLGLFVKCDGGLKPGGLLSVE